jgi:hypothetical protein
LIFAIVSMENITKQFGRVYCTSSKEGALIAFEVTTPLAPAKVPVISKWSAKIASAFSSIVLQYDVGFCIETHSCPDSPKICSHRWGISSGARRPGYSGRKRWPSYECRKGSRIPVPPSCQGPTPGKQFRHWAGRCILSIGEGGNKSRRIIIQVAHRYIHLSTKREDVLVLSMLITATTRKVS